MITQERLKTLVHYDPDTGIFTWKVNKSGHVRVGRAVGSVKNSGHLSTRIEGFNTTMHQLAFLYMTGTWPREDVDHINRIPADNRWCNLREATRSQNQFNRSAPKQNTSGVKGVSLYKPSGKWLARIMKEGKAIHLGYYDTIDDATEAYKEAALRLHGEFAMVS